MGGTFYTEDKADICIALGRIIETWLQHQIVTMLFVCLTQASLDGGSLCTADESIGPNLV